MDKTPENLKELFLKIVNVYVFCSIFPKIKIIKNEIS